MRRIERSIRAFFWNGAWVSPARPGQARQFVRTLRWQAAAARTRGEWQKRGVRVPPIIIFSITHRCNLDCVGCYDHVLRGVVVDHVPAVATAGGGAAPTVAAPGKELSTAKLESIVAEAVEIGVSFFVIAGGEPFMRPEILDIAGRFPRVVFLVFTNGLLLDEAMVARLKERKNVICLLSLEGDATETDRRRGRGTYERLVGAMARLREERLFFGCSVTLTSENLSTALGDGYIRELTEAGCRLVLFAEYTPVDGTTKGWELSEEERGRVPIRVAALRRRFPAVFVAVPWDEGQVGGCLSAGRGFVHINASGGVEPCPFAPYSDVSLTDSSLVDALRSPFLTRLRTMPGLTESAGGGCSLWVNREEVEKALAETAGPPRLFRR